MALEYALLRTGPLTMPPSQLGAFAKSDEQRTAANIEWHVQPLSLDKFGSPLHAFDAITPSVCNLQPTSRGHVRIKSADPAAHPAITLNYLATDEDLQRRGRGPAIHAPHHGGESARAVRARGVDAGPDARRAMPSSQRAAGDLGTTIFHPGRHVPHGSDALAVVDDRLRVRGIDGAARDRRVGHAAHHVGQHERADGDDRGAGRGVHSRSVALMIAARTRARATKRTRRSVPAAASPRTAGPRR